jgi:hypothetical protein
MYIHVYKHTLWTDYLIVTIVMRQLLLSNTLIFQCLFSARLFYSIIIIIIMECHYLEARSLQKYTSEWTHSFVIQITAKGAGLINISDEQWMLKLFKLQYQTTSNYDQTK